MSDRPLPDDVSKWPTNPFELLGVSPSAEARDVRKAYTALIRVYKPERHPDEFRRIRDAYEAAQRMQSWNVSWVEPEAPEPPLDPRPSSDAMHADGRPDDDASAPSREPPGPRPESTAGQAAEAWGVAIGGDLPAAYHALVELNEADPDAVDLYPRLYWLATLDPSVCAPRVPVEWLIRGIRRVGGRTLMDLLEAEVTADPAVASAEVVRDFIASVACDDPRLVRARWQSLAKRDQWATIDGEVLEQREKVCRHGEATWLELVAAVNNWVAWGRHNPHATRLVKTLRAELIRFEHLGLRYGYYFDRADHLEAIARACRELPAMMAVPNGFFAAVRDGWAWPINEIRYTVEEVLVDMATRPTAWVAFLDLAVGTAQAAVEQLLVVMDAYAQGCDHGWADWDGEAVCELVFAVFGRGNRAGGRMRARLLQFCMDEALEPSIIAAAAEGHVPASHWLNGIGADPALQLVCRANRLMRR